MSLKPSAPIASAISAAFFEAGEIEPSFVVTHPASLEDAPEMYKKFRDKKDGVIQGRRETWRLIF
jgi:threonine dehydrogenase-like Zn-dependent dehydrogenase